MYYNFGTLNNRVNVVLQVEKKKKKKKKNILK